MSIATSPGPIPGFRLAFPESTPALGFGPDRPAPVALTEKHRPRTLADLAGQADAVRQLGAFLDAPHPVAFLFDGPTGVGKTSAALALANDLGVDPDWGLHRIGSGEQDGEAVATALRALRFVAPGSGWKMILVDEADFMSQKAAQLWLSALEDLPPRSVIVFTTNHVGRFPDRFMDRLERITFRSDGETLLADAQALVSRVWAEETGRSDAPSVAALPGLVDSCGHLSFRRVVSALAPLVREARRRAAAPPVAPPAAPVPGAILATLPARPSAPARKSTRPLAPKAAPAPVRVDAPGALTLARLETRLASERAE